MVHAFVMVKADVGEAATMLDRVDSIEDVSEAHVVAGDYDLILELEAPEVYDVLQVTADEVQSLAGITDTKTYVSMEE
ncbi:ArsR family transcriptional regulator [Halalkaliarchaeum desulfuricum]|uniref:ArsR family transcriptional regulator n=1 Tax=Halalkaliarchaeum desulfuricum TaxID=2055893 RepID=A0A343TIZ2_9EURY|nr:Lrp/AsnC ligand binding domain-containing protein [Halalkaliarchaeum desulfuricum]AUX09064.1 ArsR family transcriptional regulator [Halalkaliarchaeum desulfuricum]